MVGSYLVVPYRMTRSADKMRSLLGATLILQSPTCSCCCELKQCNTYSIQRTAAYSTCLSTFHLPPAVVYCAPLHLLFPLAAHQECHHDPIASTLPMTDFIAPAPVSPTRLAQRRRLLGTDSPTLASPSCSSSSALPSTDLKDDADNSDDDAWMCSQPHSDDTPLSVAATYTHDSGDEEEVKEAAEEGADDEQAEVARRRQHFSLNFDDMPTLDAEDEWVRDESLAALTSQSLDTAALFSTPPASSQSSSSATVTAAASDAAPQQRPVMDVVDLTDDDEDLPVRLTSAPTRSASALATFTSPLSASARSTSNSPISMPRPSVRRNITDFFAQSASKQWAVKEEAGDSNNGGRRMSHPMPSFASHTAAPSPVKQEAAENNWQYLLTGRQTVKQEKAAGRGARGKAAAGRGRGKRAATDTAAGAGRGRGGRYDRFAGSYVKAELPSSVVKPEPSLSSFTDDSITDELDPSTPYTAPSMFVKGENDELRTLEHIRRYTLATGFRSGPCPAFKRLAGTDILVDGFQWSLSQPQCRSFFLSHHHSDHTVGLYRGWDIGLIYCSQITARLLVEQDGLNPAVVRAVPLHQRVYIDGVYVTLIDANHCPGAVVFVFELPPFAAEEDLKPPDPPSTVPLPRLKTGPVYVHCGDFRYCREMGELFAPGQTDAAGVAADAATATSSVPSAFNHYTSFYAAASLYHLSRLTITGVYLDTTYCKPQYNFPPQATVVNYTLNVVRDILLKEKRCNDRLRAQHQHSALSASTLSAAWQSLDTATSPPPATPMTSPATNFLNGYQRQQQQRTLFLVGSFSIGKEKVFLEVARQFGMKIYASPAKLRLINWIQLFDVKNSQLIQPDSESSQLMRDATLAPTTPSDPAHPTHNLSPFSRPLSWTQWSSSDVLTSDIRCSRLHVVPLAYCSLLKLPDYLDPAVNKEMAKIQGCYHSVVCFRPTGWVGNKMRVSEKQVEVSIVRPKEEEEGEDGKGTKKGKRKRKEAKSERKVVHQKRALQVYMHHIPYSEHSSYSELQEFVRLMVQCGLQQEQLVPTVNVQHTEQMCEEFAPIFKEKRKQEKEEQAKL